MILRGAFLQVCVGLCLGVPLSLLAGRYLMHRFYGVAGFDPPVIGAASGTYLCLCGSYPACACRAASIDPVEVLRSE